METMNKEIIILGYWDGEPIWRYKTSSEKLLELIEQNKHEKSLQSIS